MDAHVTTGSGDEDDDNDHGKLTMTQDAACVPSTIPAALPIHHQRHSGLLQRYKLIVAYDGTRFKGFQRQSSSSFSPSSSLSTSLNSPKTTQIPATQTQTDPRHVKRRRHDHSTGRSVPVDLTVQECLEDALERYTGLTRAELQFRFAGRTDAGVHARGQVVAVSLPDTVFQEGGDGGTGGGDIGGVSDIPWRIRRAINSRLPIDITIEDVTLLCGDLAETFDPRIDAIRKQYSYTLRYRRKVWGDESKIDTTGTTTTTNDKVLPICVQGGPHLLRTALDSTMCWICPWPLDDTQLDVYCLMLTGEHDYSAFVHKDARKDRNNYMTVERLDCHRLDITTKDGADYAPICDVKFVVEAKGFGRAQVRNLIGFLVDLCRGSITNGNNIADWIWNDPDHLATQLHAAPACGLCLERVFYATLKNVNTPKWDGQT